MSLITKNLFRLGALLGGVLLVPMAVRADNMAAPMMQGHATMSPASIGTRGMVECCPPVLRIARPCETAAICTTKFFRKDETTFSSHGPSPIGFYRSLRTTIPDSQARPPGRLSRGLRIGGPSLAVLYCSFQT